MGLRVSPERDPRCLQRLPPTAALLLIGHGDHLRSAHDAMGRVLARLQERAGVPLAAIGFLQISSPSVPEAIDRLVSGGAGCIILLLCFVYVGRHVVGIVRIW